MGGRIILKLMTKKSDIRNCNCCVLGLWSVAVSAKHQWWAFTNLVMKHGKNFCTSLVIISLKKTLRFIGLVSSLVKYGKKGPTWKDKVYLMLMFALILCR